MTEPADDQLGRRAGRAAQTPPAALGGDRGAGARPGLLPPGASALPGRHDRDDACAGSPALPSSAAAGCVPRRRMVTVDRERSAALLLRVWTEGDTGGFRARLTAVGTSGVARSGEEVTVAVAASPNDVLDAVRAWLEQFVHVGP